MRKYFFLLLFATSVSYAQDINSDYKAYREGLLNGYQNFRKGILDDYAKYLDGVWKEYESFRGVKRDNKPKPVDIPKADDTPIVPVNLPEPEITPVPNAPNVPEKHTYHSCY